ncbi:MAG: site-specific integrase [Planctomycetota bacterium]
MAKRSTTPKTKNLPATRGKRGELVNPAEIDAAALDFAKAARSEATQRAYRSDWAHFSEWCSASGLDSLPASPETVARYLTAFAEALSTSTLQRRLSSIAVAHQLAGHRSPTAEPGCREVWKGIRREKGVAMNGATPITREELRALLATTGDGALGVRDRALLLTGFHGAFRRSELAALDLEDVEQTEEGLRIILRRSKTDQEGEGTVKGLLFQSDLKVCPVRALLAWLDLAEIESGPVFRSVTKGGNVKPNRIDGRTVARVIQKAAKAAGLKDPEKFSGHSLRAGLATQAAADGAPERAIMAQGGWKSTATVRRYIRHGSAFRENVGKFLKLCL